MQRHELKFWVKSNDIKCNAGRRAEPFHPRGAHAARGKIVALEARAKGL